MCHCSHLPLAWGPIGGSCWLGLLELYHLHVSLFGAQFLHHVLHVTQVIRHGQNTVFLSCFHNN